MLMLLTGKNKCGAVAIDADEGFTLIEMMVVLVIVGLMASVVLLNLPSGKDEARASAEEIAARFSFAAKEAVLGGETVGVTISRRGYGFLKYRAGRWQPMTLIPDKAELFWPEGVTITLRLEGERKTLPRGTAAHEPLLYFTPTGESLPFDLMVQKDGNTARISGDRTSHLQVRIVS